MDVHIPLKRRMKLKNLEANGSGLSSSMSECRHFALSVVRSDILIRFVKNYMKQKRKRLNDHMTHSSELHLGLILVSPVRGGENHSFVNKGKGVAQGSIPNNPIPGILPHMLPNMKENPLFKEGSSGDSLIKEKNDNLGITIMDQKRRGMDNHTEVNLNNPAIEYEPMHEDPKNGATVGPA
ncbi:Uncharacterized protein Adt_33030 [Abeliophyllum distichum]|uniref:Uncharacterized protein n=1 Tax=Abeliophyllum distichum TaxID=126358 RepID=A0ABD1QV30_9LAMI